MSKRQFDTEAPIASKSDPVQAIAAPDAGITAAADYAPHRRGGFGTGGAPHPEAQAAALAQASGGQLARAGKMLLQLQRDYGNRYVQRVVNHTQQTNGAASAPVIQTKLTVGAAHDHYEQEADRVAEHVMSMPQPAAVESVVDDEELQRKPLASVITPFVQDEAEKHEPLQAKLPMQQLNEKGYEVGGAIEQQIGADRGSGSPLPDKTRAFMELRFGTDFSRVRLHTDTQADQLNRSLQARAFTTGHDIFFRQGNQITGSQSGYELLAHELTHVVQQEGTAAGPQSIQRLSSGQNLLAATDPQNAALQNIGDLLDRYNRLANRAQQLAKRLNHRFSLLRRIDQAIHQWFDQVTAQHADLASDPHTPRLQALLSETEAEHIQLVNQTKNNKFVLPFDTTGMSRLEKQQLKTLWRSIVQGTGKIKLVGGAPYNQTVLSELAKILDTPVGRDLLRYLNTPTPDAPLADPMSNIYIGENTNQLPGNVLNDPNLSPNLHNLNQSEAQPLGADKAAYELGDPQPLAGDEDLVNDFQLLNGAADFRSALLTGKEGVILNNQKYSLGTGTGSFVQTVAGAHAVQYDDNLREIIKPAYITLGHELGHSAQMRAGATTLGKGINRQSEFGEALSGKSVTNTKLYWDNSEEFFNIKNWENPIRSAHGITERGGHKSRGAILRTQRNSLLEAALLPIYNIDPIVSQLPPYVAVTGAIVNQAGNLDDDAVFNSLTAIVQNLAVQITPASVQAYKGNWLQGRFAELQNVRPTAAWGTRKATRPEWQAVRAEINNNLAHYTAAGNSVAFQTLQNRLKQLRQQHGLTRG